MNILIPILQTIFISVLVFYIERGQNKKDKEEEKRLEDTRAESLLQLELIMASAKLSYACAVALKRGKANGEVEDGILAYELAKEKYYHFLNEQAVKQLKE